MLNYMVRDNNIKAFVLKGSDSLQVEKLKYCVVCLESEISTLTRLFVVPMYEAISPLPVPTSSIVMFSIGNPDSSSRIANVF
jgi:hypothetical protein